MFTQLLFNIINIVVYIYDSDVLMGQDILIYIFLGSWNE